MALSQALSTGITGLMTHQKAMDNIGNNLANVNTVGFKKGVYQFATLLQQSLRGGMGGDADTGRGSINPISMGLGAMTGSINKAFTQGPIETTGNPTDVAIDGKGFFVLRQDNGGFAYTRAGSFYLGEDGSLLAGDGLRVQGTLAVKGVKGVHTVPQDAKMQDVIIPIGQIGGHIQTTEVQFVGNLDSRQELSYGTRLFGSTSFPTVGNLQSWMWKDFDGGDSMKKPNVDETWDALQSGSFAILQSTLNRYAAELEGTDFTSFLTVHPDGAVMDLTSDTTPVYWALDVTVRGRPELVQIGDPESVIEGMRAPKTVNDFIAGDPAYAGRTLVPLVQKLNTINGGNVQTSAAYGIKVPGQLPNGGSYTGPDGLLNTIQNDYTFPQWFYESTGAALSFDEIAALTNEDYEVATPPGADPVAEPGTGPDAMLRRIWPNGINGTPWPAPPAALSLNAHMPRMNDEYPASLSTPLENLHYRKGNTWVQAFPNIKNGDDITVEFMKGESKIEATFTYNRPQGVGQGTTQQSIDRERSFTLEHFLKFMGGDVNEPSTVGVNLTPAMFGAAIDPDHPYGNYNDANWDRRGEYDAAMKNFALAKDLRNMDSIGGAMGLLSIPPQISDAHGGGDSYDTPPESAGAYSRTGVSQVGYMRYDPVTNTMVERPADSFNVSLVSNLGKDNGIENIKITYNSVPHDAMFEGETEYEEPQGGSSSVAVEYYDSLGNPKSVTMRMSKVAEDDNFTTWRWYADSEDDSDFGWRGDPDTGELANSMNVGTGLIRFDKDGNFVKGSDYSETQGILIDQKNRGVNQPIWIRTMNGLSSRSAQALDFSELSCSATGNTFKLGNQNGRPPGVLNDFAIDKSGNIVGVYSNGNQVTLARLGLAMIPNETGLIAVGGNMFLTGPASGDALYGHAYTGGSGALMHKQLETSNVELSEEFTKLISTERGFQANSRTITTADEMITELLNLKR